MVWLATFALIMGEANQEVIGSEEINTSAPTTKQRSETDKGYHKTISLGTKGCKVGQNEMWCEEPKSMISVVRIKPRSKDNIRPRIRTIMWGRQSIVWSMKKILKSPAPLG